MRETKITKRLLVLHRSKEKLTTKEYAEMYICAMKIRQGLICANKDRVFLGSKNK